MRENTTEVVVGAVVLAAAAGFLWFIVGATGVGGGAAGMNLQANFVSLIQLLMKFVGGDEA